MREVRCELLASTAQGAIPGDETNQAFQVLRKHHQLSLLAEPKIMKTVLAAQPKVSRRIVEATSPATIHDIFVSAMKRAGLQGCLNSNIAKPERSPAPSDRSDKESTPAVSSPAPGSGDSGGRSSDAPAMGARTRWQRNRTLPQQDENRGGWRTVRRKARTQPEWTLQDEWNVPVKTQVQMNVPGVQLCEDEDQAKEILQHTQGTTAPGGIVSRQRLSLSPLVPDRVAFHLGKKVGEATTVMAAVGYIYQLHPAHCVALKRMPQTTTLDSQGSTVVLRLVCAQNWTPEPIWEALLKGKVQKLREELLRLLQEQHPAHVCSIQDVFKLELKGRTVSCCVRVAKSALKSVLMVSGQQWLFCHTLAQQTSEFPVVWTQEIWPESLKPTHQRATDINALGLVMGDRHLGYRCETSTESSVRTALGITPRSSWILAGIPVAFSMQEANAVLTDLGIASKVLEHTRRVNRVTQSWIFHLPVHTQPAEDTMHIVHQERDFFVTITPAMARNPPTQTVKEFSRPPRRVTENRTYAQAAAKSPPPRSESPEPRKQDRDRIMQLENMVALLVQTLKAAGHPVPSEASQPPPESEETRDPSDSESDEDQYMGDFEEWPKVTSERPTGTPPKKARTEAAKHDKLQWKHLDPSPFTHVVWGRVKGDGNCYWRSLALITGRPWNLLKQEILAVGPKLCAAWCEFFKVSSEEYQRLLNDMRGPDAWANELALALTALHLEAPVIVVGTPVWLVQLSTQPTMPIVLHLAKGHFSPIKQRITDPMISALQRATPASTDHLTVRGGGSCALTTWNLNSLPAHFNDIPQLGATMYALQETACRQKQQSAYSAKARRIGYEIIWGAPTPVRMNSRRSHRTDRGTVPGVALMAQTRYNLVAHPPYTEAGKALTDQGRLVMATGKLGKKRALFLSAYMPPGRNPKCTAQREVCMNQLMLEINAHRQLPMYLAGDWNVSPDENLLVASLSAKGWYVPLHINMEGEHDACTYSQAGARSTLDYWIVSPAAKAALVQNQRPIPGHAHRPVTLSIPPLNERHDDDCLPPTTRYPELGKVMGPSPIDWTDCTLKIEHMLALGHVDLAWKYWETCHHLELCARSTCRESPPGTQWAFKRVYHARLTREGEQSELLADLSALATRVVDYAKHGSGRVKQRIMKQHDRLAKHYALPSIEHLLAFPLEAAQQLKALQHAEQDKEKRVNCKKWERSLTTLKQRPTPKLYQWLRQENASHSGALMDEEGPLNSMTEVFAAHRDYWQKICKHPEGDEERRRVQRQHERYKGETLDLTYLHVLEGVKNLKSDTSAGADGWPAEAAKAISPESAQVLARLYRHIEMHGTWPPSLLRVRVVMLPKPDTPATSPADWRPISVTSIWFRLYGQLRLFPLFQHILPHLPDTVLGGVPRRNAYPEVLRLLMLVEKHVAGIDPQPTWGGISLDASKCFDRIRWSALWTQLENYGVPKPILCSLSGFYLSHARHTIVRGIYDPEAWRVTAGLLQGCALSVACTVATVATWHKQLQHTNNMSYIDDRLLTAPDSQMLVRAWKDSCNWDVQAGWVTNHRKTLCFSLDPARTEMQKDLRRAQHFVYLGHDVHMAPNTVPIAQKKRYQATLTTAQVIARLPKAISVFVRAQLLHIIALPRWAYGLSSRIPSPTRFQQLEQAFRRALWTPLKKMHCWKAAVALAYDPHRHSALGGFIYGHWRTLLMAIRPSHADDFLKLWQSDHQFGPIAVGRQLLGRIGYFWDQHTLTTPSDCTWNLADIPREPFLKELQHALRRHYLAEALQKRSHYEGIPEIDWKNTRRLLQKPHFMQVSALVTILADGLWTSPRLKHLGYCEDDRCQWCGCNPQTPGHIFWDCLRWSTFQGPAMTRWKEVICTVPAAKHCAICVLTFPDELRREWHRIQNEMCTIFTRFQDLTTGARAPTRKEEPPPPVDRTQPDTTATCEGEGSDGPWPPLPALYGETCSLSFTCLASRHTAGLTWPFTMPQWHRIMSYLTRVRVCDDPERVPTCSILEMYASYLICNDLVRFHTGLSSESHGEWLSTHLHGFTSAMMFMQGMCLDGDVLPRQIAGSPMVEWMKALKFPASLALTRGVVIPHWRRARQMLLEVSMCTPQMDGTEKDYAKLWARLPMGKAHSQCQPELGTLSPHPLPWQSPRRISQKTRVPRWYNETRDCREFIRGLLSDPRLSVQIHDQYLWEILRDAGVCTWHAMRAYVFSRKLFIKRATAFLSHAQGAAQRRQHVTADVEVGVRPRCYACGHSSHVSKAMNWFRQTCPAPAAVTAGAVIQRIEEQIDEAKLIIAQVNLARG